MIPAERYKMILDVMPIVCIDSVIVNANREYLLVKRNNHPLKGEYWLPGGRLLKNETLREAVIRKMNQELGIAVEIDRLLGFFETVFKKTSIDVTGGFHAVSFVFLLKPLQEKIVLDNQSSSWKWFKELPRKLLELLQPFQEES